MVISEKYLGYSIRDTKIDLSETSTDKLKKDLKRVQTNINELEKELYATKGSAPVYGIKEQISNLELMKSRIEKELSEREESKMENVMFDEMRDFLQECVNDGSLNVDDANELYEFAIEDYSENDYSANVNHISSVVEACIEKLGITDISIFESMEGDEIIDYIIEQVRDYYEAGKLNYNEASLMLEYLNLDNYDENGIFVESIISDAKDSLDREDSNSRKEAALVGVDNNERPTFNRIVKQVDAGGKKIDAETRRESPEQFREKIIGDTPHKSFEKLPEGSKAIPADWVQGRRVIKAQTVSEKADGNMWANAGEQLYDGLVKGAAITANAASDVKKGIKKTLKKAKSGIEDTVDNVNPNIVDNINDFKTEVKIEQGRRKITKTVNKSKKEIQGKIDKLESEIERLKEKLSKEDDKNEKKKITAKITSLFAKLKSSKEELKKKD